MKQLIKKIVKVVPKTMKQIAEGYGISTRVFRGWLTPSFKKKLGARKGQPETNANDLRAFWISGFNAP